MQPRLQLIAPTQVRLLGNVDVNRDSFKKNDIVTIEKHDADYLIERKLAEKVNASEKLESVNRFVQAEAKPTKTEQKAAEALRAAGEESSGEARTVTSPKETVAVNADAVTNTNTSVKR